MQAAHPWPVYGHDWAVEYLRKGIRHDRIRHAYLITGTESVGKSTLATAFAMALNCEQPTPDARPCGECRACKLIRAGNHIDMLYSETDANTGVLKIDTIRSVTNRIAMKPYEARYRVAIFADFDHAQPRAQDALLKTLEEPPPYAVLILLASSLEPILPTITSRSQVIRLRPVSTEMIHNVLMQDYGADNVQAALLSGLSGGRIGWAINTIQQPELLDQRQMALDLLDQILAADRKGRFDLANDLANDKPALAQLLELWLTYWRDLLHKTEGSTVRLSNADRQIQIEQAVYSLRPEEALTALQATRGLLNQLAFNINLRLALEVMLLAYPGLRR